MNGADENAKNLDIQYLNYCLTAFAYGKNNYDLTKLSQREIPKDIASYNKQAITADKLIEAKTLILISGFEINTVGNILEEEINRIEEKYSKTLADKIIIWGDNYLQNAFMFNYICSEVLLYNNDCKIYKLEKITSNSNDYKPITAGVEYLNILDNMGLHKCSRKVIYGLEEYPNISVKRCWISGFENFPPYSSCCIYSPFTNKREIENLLNHVKDMPESDIKSYIRENLSSYITPYMISIIKEYNIHADISDNKIKEDYIKLIYDFIKLKQNS